jgi:hypothetical protein
MGKTAYPVGVPISHTPHIDDEDLVEAAPPEPEPPIPETPPPTVEHPDGGIGEAEPKDEILMSKPA